MQYYQYISDAKVDMLFPQVPNATQHKVAAKFGFDIKLFAGSIETQRNTFDSLVARLKAVEEHIISGNSVGDFMEQTPWIKGLVEAKFIDLGDGAILYITKTENSFVALGGSARHLIGGASPESVDIPFSHLYSLTKQLTKLVEKEPDSLLSLPEDFLGSYIASGVSQEFDAWINVIEWAWSNASGIQQQIEFLAKRLVSKTSNQDTLFTLATPLYVISP